MAERSEYYGSMLLQKGPPAVVSDEYDDTSKGLRPRQSPTSLFRVQRKWMRSVGVSVAVLALLMLSYSFSRHARYHADTDLGTNHRIRHNSKKQDASTTRFAAMQSLVAELEPLREPEVRRSVDGVLNTTLHVNTVHFTDGPISFRTRSYEGSIPGPTLSIKAGDTINIELVNNLLPNEPGPWAMNTMHNPNTTNLHVHGMHVDPTGIADNVFRVVEPGHSALTQIYVPKDHPRGLFHYHPHYHGSVFAQMGGGMVGGLIVEDDDDDGTVPEEYRNLKSHLIVLQEFRFSGGMASSAVAVAEASHSHLPMQPKYTPKTIFDARVRKLFPHVHQAQASVELELSEGLENHYAAPDKLPQIADYFTVNGQYIPKIEIQPNENRILRFVNTGGVCALELSVPGCTMQLAATDGIYLSAPRSIRTLVLSPGSRADVVFNCAPNSDAAHEFEPLRPLQSVNNPALNGFVGALTDVYEGIIAFFHVKGPSLDMKPLTRVPVPTPLYGEPSSLLNLSQEDRDLMDPEPFLFEFTMGKPRHVDGFTYKTYLINGEEFEGKSIRDMKLGVVQEWVIINKDEMKGELTDKNHPFHLHTNAFQIVAMSHGEGVEYEIGDWRDVILVPTPGNVTIRFRPVDFTGLIVAHCHILGHSDAGMVAAVTITP
uniref:Plastocyanin-like domain-containing protein n=1 Tax=Globisporangium ultimum (strain ATCC 200006 / CBS 805.95 / DAOM BR144) TaxID=431595 RepID=K3WE38_GLOUD